MNEYRLSMEVLSQEVAGETVVLDLDSECYFGLDEVGTRVWNMLRQGVTFEAIIDRLLEEYDVEREELERDVRGLLRQLLESGLVQRG
jgi:hypothetical protein